MKILSLFLAFSIVITISLALEPPTVNISQGELLGVTSSSRNGRPFNIFLGIPYGKVPRRFDLSEPADSWTGIRDATKPGPWCIQSNFLLGGKISGQEDCLILNIMTPKMNESLPVMVFIHGGGFVQGSANEFGGVYLMDHDVVYVAINYRLNAFGFLNAGVDGASGNQGLKDQVLALKWIKNNIDKFGGNPSKITIFGESAGAASVSLLTLSPMTKGLVQAAISQSGNALSPFADRKEPPLLEAKKLANLLDCPASDPSYMIQCLRKISANDIAIASRQKHINHLYFDVYDVPQFGPSVEQSSGNGNDSSVFMPEDPLKILSKGTFNKIPWINGVNAEEGIVVQAAPVLYNDTLRELINEEWGRVAPSTFLYHSNARDPCKLSSKIKEFYFGDEKIGLENRQKLVDLYSDRFFLQTAKQTAKLYAKHAPVYAYYFTHENNNSVSTLIGWPDNNGLKSPSHADDLQYIFDFPVFPYSPGVPRGSPHEEFSYNLIKLWVSFANEGKPTAVWGDEKEWPMLKPDEKPFMMMNIGNELKLEPENVNITRRLDFWDQLLLPIQNKTLQS